jgi:hypothetical protein
MQRLKIDLRKIPGAKHFTAKDGTDCIAFPTAANNIYVGEKGTYMEVTLMDNRDGEDQYGNNGFVVMDIGKARREAGEKGTILGNWKHLVIPTQAHSQSTAPKRTAAGGVATTKDGWDDDGIPF